MGHCSKTMPIIPPLPRKQEQIKGTWVREKILNTSMASRYLWPLWKEAACHVAAKDLKDLKSQFEVGRWIVKERQLAKWANEKPRHNKAGRLKGPPGVLQGEGAGRIIPWWGCQKCWSCIRRWCKQAECEGRPELGRHWENQAATTRYYTGQRQRCYKLKQGITANSWHSVTEQEKNKALRIQIRVQSPNCCTNLEQMTEL